ncbi:MAG: hypothetical protein RRB13_10750 [bacterium]|nr:hypothetical protein [bacterium]
MLRLTQLIDFLTSQTSLTAGDCAALLLGASTRRFQAQGSSIWVDQSYQAQLVLSNLHKTRIYPAICLSLFDWFEQFGHPEEGFEQVLTESDALHFQATLTLRLVEYLQWSPLTPAEELTIATDDRVVYQEVEYKQTQRTSLIGL